MSSDTVTNIIQGNPTKTFFIEMISRDISIKDSILDLLDNSIDAANSINSENYEGFKIDIIINKDEFVLIDNCGGFSLDIAQKYVFRFGRPDERPDTENSIGRFGVGMKRALFKMGNKFEIESMTHDDHFQVDVNVSEWKAKKTTITNEQNEKVIVDDWNFNYKIVGDELKNLEFPGVFIKVSELSKEVSNVFDDDEFKNKLQIEIEKLLNFSLEKGIKITLNGKELERKGIVLFNDSTEPYFFKGNFDGVDVKIVAGLSHVGKPETSGWYIYCNNRLVVEADRSELTLWGTSVIPKWHVDFVMFKGVMFFDSKDTIKLPLTTTKKGIDASSDVYIKSKTYIKEAMNSIIPFLRSISKLGADANNYRELLGEQEEKIKVTDLKTKDFTKVRTFTPPEINIENIEIKKNDVRISFQVNKKLADSLRDHTQTKSYGELGHYLFDYYIKMEDIDNE